MSETITTTGRFSILVTGRLVVTVRQTGGAPGAILTLSEIIQGQNADIIDQIGIAALNTTYVIDVPVAGSDAIVDLTNLPGGAASFVVTIQGAGTT